MAKDLCARAGITVEDYNNGSKTFSLEEMKLFAQLLVAQYGIAVHNSLTANNKVFESSAPEDQKLFHGLICLTLKVILIPSQSRRDLLEHTIGVNSATNAIMTNRIIGVFQTALLAKL